MSSILTSVEGRFADWNLRILLILVAVCLPIIFILDFRGLQSAITAIISFILIFWGRKLHEGETSENWLDFSFFKSAKNVFGGVLILTGWIGFLRGVLAIAIASILLWLS